MGQLALVNVGPALGGHLLAHPVVQDAVDEVAVGQQVLEQEQVAFVFEDLLEDGRQRVVHDRVVVELKHHVQQNARLVALLQFVTHTFVVQLDYFPQEADQPEALEAEGLHGGVWERQPVVGEHVEDLFVDEVGVARELVLVVLHACDE